jgi:hypothetical protein
MMWTATPLRPDVIIITAGILDGDALEKLAPKVETFTSRQFEKGFSAPPLQ